MARLGSLLLLGVGLFALAVPGTAQQLKSLEFRNQDLRDILLTLGGLNSVSIVPDETVEGKASYVFADMNFDQALQVFLDTYHLGYRKAQGVYYVSRVAVKPTTDGLWTVDATDVPIRLFLKVFSQLVGRTVLFDNLPNDPLTIHAQGVSIDQVLGIVVAKYQDFTVDRQDQFYYLRTKTSAAAARPPTGGGITKSGELYTLKVDKARFRDLLGSLFSQAQKEFVLLVDRDIEIQNLTLKDKSFDEILKALLLQVNADYTVQQSVYYLVEVQRKDLLKKYQTTAIVSLRWVSASDVLKLLPPGLGASATAKFDEKGNKVVLSGMMEEIKPLWDFLQLVDKPSTAGLPLRVDLSYLKTDEFLPLLPSEFQSFAPQALPSKQSFLIVIPEERRQVLGDFVRLVDRPASGFPVRLHYLKADDLLAKLPPSAPDQSVSKTADPSLVFFKGTLDQRNAFLRDLAEMDQPRPQIRYQLLVLQFQDGQGLNLSSSVKVTSSKGSTAYTGEFSSLMTVDFDVVSQFGASFAASLSAGLTSTKTRVVADTTLNGLSGEKLSFQNTTTTRYKDTETTTTSGTTTTASVVRELTSGLLLNVEGWSSGDQMITLKIDTTLSKEVTSTSSTDSLPGTSEKKISTQVRTPSSKPVIISGLKQEDASYTLEKTPILGDIPLLGLLFQKRTESVEKTEFAIYLVPILERPGLEEQSETQRLLALYQRLGGTPQ